jgi:thiamine biosynthesis lipoprotein
MLCAHHRFRAMGSPCEIRVYGETRRRCDELARLGIDETLRLETKYSRYRDDSVTSAINASAGDASGLEVDAETARLLDYAATAWRESGGLFDATSGVLRRVWDWKSGRVPAQAEIDAVLERVGWQKVDWRRPRLVLPIAGMELDFGGFVKEYAADRVADLCRAAGAKHGLVDLGGDLAVIGPHPDRSPWLVGIRDPRDPKHAMATVQLLGGGIATSGDYERGMTVDGVRYTHVLDPRTGWPVRGLRSVSVAARRCLIAGTATTVAMLKGAADGPRWLEELGLPSLYMDESGELVRLARGLNAASSDRCAADARRDREA